MWFVRLALNRPYTFIILALLILVLSPMVISSTPADIFPNIDIPVIAVAWSYTALNPEELEGRLTTPYEKGLTSLVDNVEHVESTTYNGVVIVKIFFQPSKQPGHRERPSHGGLAIHAALSSPRHPVSGDH